MSKSQSDVPRVFDRWVDTHWSNKGPKPKLDKKRTAKIKQRLAEGFTVDQLWQAIDGCRASSWHMGDNSSGTCYNKLETILRDAGAVEAHINRLLSSREVQPTDPIDSEFASLVAEKNSGPTPERLLAVDTRLAELAAMRQREKASSSTSAPIAVRGRQ